MNRNNAQYIEVSVPKIDHWKHMPTIVTNSMLAIGLHYFPDATKFERDASEVSKNYMASWDRVMYRIWPLDVDEERDEE